MIHVSVGDEEEVVGDSSLGASPDVEGYLERGEHYACLLPSDGETLHLITFDLQTLLLLLLLSSLFQGLCIGFASRTHID